MLGHLSKVATRAAALAAVALPAPAARALTWNSSVIDATEHHTPGEESSLAIDASGRVHIAYLDGPHQAVKYAHTNAAGVIVTEVVDDFLRAGDGVSLALDASGMANLLYFREPEFGGAGDLVYARRSCAIAPDLFCSWTKTTLAVGVHETTSDGSNTAIAIDRAGTIHGVYVDNAHDQLMYLRRDSGGWSALSVTPLTDSGGVSIAVDANNLPRVAFGDDSVSTRLVQRFAQVTCVFILCGWQIETIDVGTEGVIALSSTGQVSVAFVQGFDARLARRICDASGGNCTWKSERVAEVSGGRVALAVSPSGAPHLAFYAFPGELRYARRSLFPSLWTVERADPLGALGGRPSIALTGAGEPVISHFDDENDDLRLSRGVGPVISPSVGALPDLPLAP